MDDGLVAKADGEEEEDEEGEGGEEGDDDQYEYVDIELEVLPAIHPEDAKEFEISSGEEEAGAAEAVEDNQAR